MGESFSPNLSFFQSSPLPTFHFQTEVRQSYSVCMESIKN